MNRVSFREGYSLVELILAIGLCTFSIASVLSVMVPAIRTSRSIEDYYHAVDAAKLLRFQLSDEQVSSATQLYYNPIRQTLEFAPSPNSLILSLSRSNGAEIPLFESCKVSVKMGDKLLYASVLSGFIGEAP